MRRSRGESGKGEMEAASLSIRRQNEKGPEKTGPLFGREGGIDSGPRPAGALRASKIAAAILSNQWVGSHTLPC
jgi:hypothetical protein